MCLEIDTEDAEIWTQIDSTLAQKFGCVHVIWGIDTDNGREPKACTLPGYLFYVTTSQTEGEFAKLIVPILKQIWSGGYKLMCIGNRWHYQEQPYTILRESTLASQPVDLEVSREA